MPDDNELNFDKPERALLATVREVLADDSIKFPNLYLEEITRLYVNKTVLRLDDGDWLSNDEKREADPRYQSRHRIALCNFINWISIWSGMSPRLFRQRKAMRNGPCQDTTLRPE